MPAYTELDCGTGILNIEKAYQTLGSYRKSGFASKLIDYTIQTESPNLGTEAEGPAAYWRTVNFLQNRTTQNFKVTPVFSPDFPTDERVKFFRLYTLRSTAKWLKPLQQTLFIRGEKNSVVSVLYDQNLLKAPGLYVGKVIATPALSKAGKSDPSEVEFELQSTVIVPYQFESKGKVLIENERLSSGKIKRYFFAVPAGSSALRIRIFAKNESGRQVNATIINHSGKIVGYVPTVMTDDLTSDDYVSENLEPGIYEVVVEASGFDKPQSAIYSLEATLLLFQIQQASYQPNLLRLSLSNSGNTAAYGLVRGQIEGYKKVWSDTVFAGKVFRKPILFSPNETAVEIRFSVSAHDYNKNTDATLMLVDSTGKRLASKNLESLSEKVYLYNPYEKRDSGAVFLEIHYGFAFSQPNNFIEFSADEFHRTGSLPLECDPSSFELIPFISQEVEVNLPELNPVPEGFQRVGTIRFDESKSGISYSQFEFILNSCP
ncbi:MAG: hypothetical protein HGB19_11125, partial [Chlorobiales bacterium]|nr:hypothetical protein [Chlorobiales bacterium]